MKKSILFILGLLSFCPVFASYNSFGLPDSSENRKKYVETWFEAPLTTVRTNKPERFFNEIGQEFEIRLEETDSSFNIFVAPHAEMNVTVYSDKGSYVEKKDIFPGDYEGSFVLVRDKKTGNPLRIRYYFLKNSEVFVQFTPYGKTALADLVVFGYYAARGVSTGLPFSYFYTSSFEDLYKVTKNELPWNYVTIDTGSYHSIQQMALTVKENLPYMQITPDAMYDENNDLIHISTGKKFENNEINKEKLQLSSAGFVKWIGDGLVEPISGGRLKRQPLVKETVSVKNNGYEGVLSQKYNLYFSLDWIRNLASAVVSAQYGKTYLFNQSGVDVTINPFASSITAEGIENPVIFIENTGYSVPVLKSLLYVLAATEPGAFYFGAIRETDRSVSPEIKAFNENVVFFPYFMDDGGFDCYVFMNGRQYTLELFQSLYAQDFVYLTKAKSSEDFYPETVKVKEKN